MEANVYVCLFATKDRATLENINLGENDILSHVGVDSLDGLEIDEVRNVYMDTLGKALMKVKRRYWDKED